MKHVQLTTGRLVAFETERQVPRQRKSVFRIIFEAMHYSRRLQAERTLYQYRHLIGKANSESSDELKSNQKPEVRRS